MIYFSPDAAPAYAAVGITHNRAGYFASRVSAMGAVPAEVVIATFYNFHPGLVRRAMDGVWQRTTPEAMVNARLNAVHTSLTRAFGDEVLASSELKAAAELNRRAAMVACEHMEGRPLFAAHAALSWPQEPHLMLWHAQTLLREFRGDGHIAALVAEGLSGLEALITHAAAGDVPAAALRLTRSWNEEEWAVGVQELVRRGLLNEDETFSDVGRAQRNTIEEITDLRASAPYSALGDDACATLRVAGKKLTALVMEAGLLTFDPRRLTDPE